MLKLLLLGSLPREGVLDGGSTRSVSRCRIVYFGKIVSLQPFEAVVQNTDATHILAKFSSDIRSMLPRERTL